MVFKNLFMAALKRNLIVQKEFENLGELVEAIHQTINYYNKR